MSHYQTLGVDKTSTPDEIKKAYRKLASQHHPDKGGDTATFQKIEEAYRILSDPTQRQQYDRPIPQGNPFAGFQQAPGGFNFNFNGDINDLFGQMFNQHNQRHPNQPHAFRTSINITLEQSYTGGSQPLRLQTPNGTHAVNIEIPKSVTDNQQISVLDLIVGEEFEFTTISGKTLMVRVPPKTQPYMHLKIAGEGMPIPNSSIFGDQILLLKPFVPATIDDEITQSILRSKSK